MPIDSLYLEKFRLFDSKKIELSPERSLIVGNNGSGKTSILEAVEILFSGKSFRSSNTLDCLNHTESFFKNRFSKKYKNFNLIKGDTNENYSLYSSHSTWDSKEDFINWTKSEAFRLAHKNAAQHRDLYLGPPDFEGFKVIF